MINRVLSSPVWIRRALVLDPHIRRVGFAAFGNHQLVDWGIRMLPESSLKTRVARALVPCLVALLDDHNPSVLVLPKTGKSSFRRSARVARGVAVIAQEAAKRGIPVVFMSHGQVRDAFRAITGKRRVSKASINRVIVDRYPELAATLPRLRRVWDPEQHYTPLFNAVSMYLAWRHPPLIAET